MKILNLYAGIGGNRKLWGNNHEITAVEYKQEIADIYHDFFPDDKMVVANAHEYLLKHFEEFDFIWSSPPCPSHSRIRKHCAINRKGFARPEMLYPDMRLYEEIIFLRHYFKGKWSVENVIAYYKPLIPPFEIQRHHFWTNFVIQPTELEADNIGHGIASDFEKKFDFDLSRHSGVDKRHVLRNCVNPELGKHILDCALGLNKQKTLNL